MFTNFFITAKGLYTETDPTNVFWGFEQDLSNWAITRKFNTVSSYLSCKRKMQGNTIFIHSYYYNKAENSFLR